MATIQWTKIKHFTKPTGKEKHFVINVLSSSVVHDDFDKWSMNLNVTLMLWRRKPSKLSLGKGKDSRSLVFTVSSFSFLLFPFLFGKGKLPCMFSLWSKQGKQYNSILKKSPYIHKYLQMMFWVGWKKGFESVLTCHVKLLLKSHHPSMLI